MRRDRPESAQVTRPVGEPGQRGQHHGEVHRAGEPASPGSRGRCPRRCTRPGRAVFGYGAVIACCIRRRYLGRGRFGRGAAGGVDTGASGFARARLAGWNGGLTRQKREVDLHAELIQGALSTRVAELAGHRGDVVPRRYGLGDGQVAPGQRGGHPAGFRCPLDPGLLLLVPAAAFRCLGVRGHQGPVEGGTELSGRLGRRPFDQLRLDGPGQLGILPGQASKDDQGLGHIDPPGAQRGRGRGQFSQGGRAVEQ